MRNPLMALSAVLVAACATVSEHQVEAVRFNASGPVEMEAGDYLEDSPFSFNVRFENAGDRLGAPVYVGWTVSFGDYCRDRPSWVEAVLIDASGQIWRGRRTEVPAGPYRTVDWSTGYVDTNPLGNVEGRRLRSAIMRGGRFTLALQDDEGRRWNTHVIDTPAPAERQRLFAASRTHFVADEAEEMLEVVSAMPYVALPDQQVCP